VPQAILRLKDQGYFIGHALRPRKGDPFAFAAILYHLNEIGRNETPPRKFCLAVSYEDVESITEYSRALFPKFNVDRFLVPMGFLKNTELYKLMKLSSFSLLYDVFPEPFGIYPLDSVHNHSPGYSNGAGNLRHLLPPGHGINIFENFQMHFGSPKERASAYKVVAESILNDIKTKQGVKDCKNGEQYIQSTYNFNNFVSSWNRALTFLRTPEASRHHIVSTKDLRLTLGPLVRSIDIERGRVISDYLNCELTKRGLELYLSVLGEPMACLKKLKLSDRDIVVDMMRQGILAGTSEPHYDRLILLRP
jgi:hypothetical protein